MTNFEVFMRAKDVKVIYKDLYYYRYGRGTSRYITGLFNDVINVYKV